MSEGSPGCPSVRDYPLSVATSVRHKVRGLIALGLPARLAVSKPSTTRRRSS